MKKDPDDTGSKDAGSKQAKDGRKERALQQVKADQEEASPQKAPGGQKANTSPAGGVASLSKEASARNVTASSSRIRDILISSRPLGVRNLAWALFCGALVFILLTTLTGRLDTLAQDFFSRFDRVAAAPPAPPEAPAPEARAQKPYALSGLAIHPDVMYRPYTAGPLFSAETPGAGLRLIPQFRELLGLYTKVQSEDTNFDIRVIDNRTNELLELYTLESEQARYEREQPSDYDWSHIDGMRRTQTRRLVDKYEARGIPNRAITVKWGRANQVREARERDAPIIEYEVKLARYLGMSLLTTELGTVETFNQDRLVSGVGARSRYQMMPYLLRRNKIYHYALPTAAGNTISVAEEWHPLLTMEPAFRTMRGYINAAGHEIPGLSAYHTGPGNIYTVYRKFLANESERFTPQTTVMDAYMWAVTEGFDTVSEGTSFGPYSRKYVASAYGALKASEDVPIDTAQSMRAEQVQLKPDRTVQLSRVLRVLDAAEDRVYWGAAIEQTDSSPYERFRRLNLHMDLPDGEDAGVPLSGDVRLTARASGHPLRFFLPLGASAALADAGLNVLDERKTFRFDRNAYPDPERGEKTLWDRQYDELMRKVSTFGFNWDNRRQLADLGERFKEMAEQTPTHYREAQAEIIETHRRLWRFGGWEKVADATAAVRGTNRAPIQPPTSLTPVTPSLRLNPLR